MKSGFGIWWKLVAGFILFAFMPLMVLGYMQYSSGKEQIIEATRQGLYSLVTSINERIADYVEHTKHETVVMAMLPDIVESAEVLSASSGGARHTSARMRAADVFRSFMSSELNIESAFLLHPVTGEVLAASNPFDEGKFFDKRPYFNRAREALTVYPVHYSPAREKSILAMAAPVLKGDRLVGVLVVWANIEQLRHNIKFPSDTHVYLINRSNMYVMDSHVGEGGLSIVSGVFTPQAKRALDGESGSCYHVDMNGEHVIGAFTHVDTLDLALMAEKPVDDVLADINGMGLRLLMVMLVLGAGALIASLLVARRIAAPLEDMSRRAMEIASGELGYTVHYEASDEIGRLGRSMNVMAERIRERERRNDELISTLEALVQHMPEGVVLLDADSRVAKVNIFGEAYLRELTGVSVGMALTNIKGRPLDEFMVSPPQMKWHEVEHQREGSSEPVYYSIAMRKIEAGRAGMVIVIKDVSEEHQIRQKAQSQDKLAAVGQLASGIAHDFSNIITCVMGFSEMLASDEKLSEDAARQVEAIRQSSVRAAELIGQILDFSRRSISEMKVLDLKVQVAGFIRFINRILPENIQISIEAGQGEFLVKADPSKLEQVLTNLAVNARDAMPEGGRLDFRLSLEHFEADAAAPLPDMPEGMWVALEVSDTGQGMSEETIKHIFEPFYTTKGLRKGTGLGLAQVYGIVKLHGGFITVRSTEGLGTTFMIYLPATMEREPGEAADEILVSPKGEGQTILVVEDDFVVRDIIVRVFVSLGYKVIGASDAEEAIRIYEAEHGNVSITLTDIVMPGMDGIAMCKRMSEIDPGFRAIVISGYSPDSVRFAEGVNLASVGIVQWVQKPFQPSELAKLVHGILTR